MKLSYFVSTAICRSYFFLTATLLGVIGAETWFHVGVMMAAGLAIDVVRNVVVSDLRQPMSQVATALSQASAGRTDSNVSRHPLLFCGILFGSYAAYVIAIMILDGLLGSERSNEYFRLWTWLHEAVSPYMHVIDRHAGQIESLGHPERTLIATHLYAVSAVFIVVGAVWTTSAALPLMTFGAEKVVREGEVNPDSRPIPKRLLAFSYTLVFGVYWTLMDHIEVGEKGFLPWRIHTSNIPFIMLFNLSWLISAFLGLTYGVLIRYRQRSWTGSSGHTNVTAQLPHE